MASLDCRYGSRPTVKLQLSESLEHYLEGIKAPSSAHHERNESIRRRITPAHLSLRGTTHYLLKLLSKKSGLRPPNAFSTRIAVTSLGFTRTSMTMIVRSKTGHHFAFVAMEGKRTILQGDSEFGNSHCGIVDRHLFGMLLFRKWLDLFGRWLDPFERLLDLFRLVVDWSDSDDDWSVVVIVVVQGKVYKFPFSFGLDTALSSCNFKRKYAYGEDNN